MDYYWQFASILADVREANEKTRSEREDAERYLQDHPPEIGPFSKVVQAAIPDGNGLMYVDARIFSAAPWGSGPSIMLGICKAWKVFCCFDWHTGRRIATGKTRKEAIHNAIVTLYIMGREAYHEAVNIVTEQNGGKHLN